MKNKIYPASLVVILALCTVSMVSAQVNGNPTPQQVREEVREQVQNVKADVAAQAIQQRLENKYNRITNRFQATIDRLNNIIIRLESRISKIKAEGGDTTKAQEQMDTAKKFINDAQASMTTLADYANKADNGVANEIASTTKEMKDVLANLRKTSTSTTSLLKQAHVSLAKTIGLLRGLRTGQTASTTPSN